MGYVGALDIRVRCGIGRWQEDLATADIAGTDSPLDSEFIIIIIISVININNLITYAT